ncbi:MAG TPA: nitroreductase family protein [Candidatus Lachnoclostridium stercorigallinarum]|uniref:Nitroreductase family protein n=1 Tax=Candidatus Lachnoclostridium stercorigallinarum TaxID=2838634 RepID=A0A9D2GFD8_9FIRM|nr:nitroreductase family protein [Candidatus Lachnoclostridium stercorigallinarum]
MYQTMETILTRRSIRSFEKKPIPEEDMKQIVDAALHAPSAMGRQTWKFTVVMNREKIQQLARAAGKVLGREDYDMYSPEALIIPSNSKESRFGRDDNACAMENIFLAAHSLGIGSVWINQLHGICDEPAVREVLREFGIPDDHVVYGLAALGYADDTVIQPKERIGTVAWIR